MKEASGEMNATIIVVMLISVMATFFFFVLWPSINNTISRNMKCSDAMCDGDTVDGNGFAECVYIDKKGVRHNLTCVWKG